MRKPIFLMLLILGISSPLTYAERTLEEDPLPPLQYDDNGEPYRPARRQPALNQPKPAEPAPAMSAIPPEVPEKKPVPPRYRVAISLKDKLLFLKSRHSEEEPIALKSFPVAVGSKKTPTPPGRYLVTQIAYKPTWTIPPSIQKEMSAKGKSAPKTIPPGPKNPLGAVFIRLNESSLGIHGTNAPRRIPGEITHGCIRMRNEDALHLAKLLKKGDEVQIIQGSVR